MNKPWSFLPLLSRAVATVLGRGVLTRSASLEWRRAVLRLKRQSPANSTATASTTPTTSLVSGNYMHLSKGSGIGKTKACSWAGFTAIHFNVSDMWACELLFLLMKHLPADWSTCQLSDRAVCGNGIKTRMLDCVRSDGKSVDLKFCKEVSRVAFPRKAIFIFILLFEKDCVNNTLFSLAAGPGEEVADECFLCCGMSRQLPAVWLVTMVRVHPHLWVGRYVLVVLSAAVFPCYSSLALQVEVSHNKLLHKLFFARVTYEQPHGDLIVSDTKPAAHNFTAPIMF